MSLRTVRQIGDEILKKKSKDVKTIDDKTKMLIEDMKETMLYHEGCGLAAVQVGVLKNIIIVKPETEGEIYLFINPTILRTSEEKNVAAEGCLSVEGKQGEVERFSEIEIKAFDINMKEFTLVAKDFFARAIQHEIDHLNGILYVEKVVGQVYDVEDTEEDDNEKHKKNKKKK